VDIIKLAEASTLDFFLFGGSLITRSSPFDILKAIKEITKIPVVLFPSSSGQLRVDADAVLFLSLISGRNPDYLIGQHVTAAPLLKQAAIEVLPTGYLLISCGKPTTAEYISQTMPIPYEKAEIAAITALAGQMLGLQMIYLDGGSGADKPVSTRMVEETRKQIDIPLIVGGGIRTAQQAAELRAAGADVIVIGNAAQFQPKFIAEVCEKIR